MEHKQMQHSPYRHLAWMLVLSFAAMYVLMYAMVDTLANVYNNVNQLYMAADDRCHAGAGDRLDEIDVSEPATERDTCDRRLTANSRMLAAGAISGRGC